MSKIKFAPEEIFQEILKWAIIPTFDLVIQYGNEGIIIAEHSIL